MHVAACLVHVHVDASCGCIRPPNGGGREIGHVCNARRRRPLPAGRTPQIASLSLRGRLADPNNVNLKLHLARVHVRNTAYPLPLQLEIRISQQKQF